MHYLRFHVVSKVTTVCVWICPCSHLTSILLSESTTRRARARVCVSASRYWRAWWNEENQTNVTALLSGSMYGSVWSFLLGEGGESTLCRRLSSDDRFGFHLR